MPEEFHQATVIGKVLSTYGLGIGGAWIAHRMEGMIAAGALRVVTPPSPDDPVYHRTLRKQNG